MRHPLIILACVVLLGAASPPPPYDVSALPEAAAARQHALNACQTRAATLTTDRARVDCGLGAYRAYAVTEKLRDMRLFETYAAAMRRISAAVDSGKLSAGEAYSQAAAARAQYQSAVDKQFADWQASQPHNSPLFDRAALARASADHDRAVKICGAWADAKSIKPRMACVLAAGQQFAAAIHLQDTSLFYGYASVLASDAADAQDGRRAPAQMADRQQTLWGDFLTTINQAAMGWGR